MSASNKKSWILVAVGGVAALAAVLYGIRWISHQQTRKVVTQQVEEWESLWLPARACLVGDESTFESAGYAYLLYEATHTSEFGRERECEPLIRKLKRPGDEATGVDRVEASWDNIRAATKKLSNAFVLVIDQSTYSPMGERRAALVEALDDMDAAHARLRDDSDMDPLPRRGDMDAPGPLEEGVMPAGLDFSIYSLEVQSGNKVLVSGASGEANHTAVLSGLDDIRQWRMASAPSMNLAADENPWVVWTTDESAIQELRTADLDSSGARVGEEVPAYVAPSPSHRLMAQFALGHGDHRAVFFQVDNHADDGTDPRVGLQVVRSSDRGATWSPPVNLARMSQIVRQDFANQRFDIVLFADDGSQRWLSVNAATLATMAPPQRFPGTIVGTLDTCAHGDSVWWIHDRRELFHAKGTSAIRPVALDRNEAQIVQCTEGAILLQAYADDGVLLYRCDPHQCQQAMTVPAANSSQQLAAFDKDGDIVAMTQTDQLILVWRDGEVARSYLCHGDESIRGLVEWGGTLHLIVSSDESGGARFVPLTM